MIDIFIGIIGTIVGIGIGLIPGMHINNFLAFFLFIPFLESSSTSFFFIIGASMGFVFSSFFPAILLGVPTEDSAIAILPGHRLVLEGNAFTALLLSFYGALLAMFFSAVFLILFLIFLPTLYPHLDFIIPIILIAVTITMILSDNRWVLMIVVMSSALGFMTFNFNLLLPLLTGFFGLSTLLISLMHDTTLPKQNLEFSPNISSFEIIRCSFIASFLSSVAGLLPGVSSSIVALVGKVFGRLRPEEFLVMIGATNSAYMIYSFFALFFIEKMRSGSAVYLAQIIQNENVFFAFGIALLSGTIAAIICLKSSRHIVDFYRTLNYRKVTIASIAFLIAINIILAGAFGLLILFCSTSIGLLCCFLNVKRINCMAALIVPTVFVLI